MQRTALATLLLAILALAWWIVADDPEAPALEQGAGAVDQATGGTLPTVAAGAAAPPELHLPPAVAADVTPLDVLPQLVLRVVHADGRPAHRAIVLVLREPGASSREALLARSETDGEGRLTLPGWPGQVELLVGGAGWRPTRHLVDPGHGEHEVALAAGALVAGRVSIGGRPPAEPLELTLEPPPVYFRFEHGLRDEFFRRASDRHGRGGWNSFLTAADGSFQVTNLPDGWSGTLQCPSRYRFTESGTPLFALTAPATGLHLELQRLPVIRGRVVDASGEPVPGASVHASVGFRGGGFGGVRFRDFDLGARLETSSDGRFEIAMVGGRVRSLELVVTAAGSRRANFVRGAIDDSADHDLGDIVLAEARTVAFRALDGSSAPIAGALATVDGVEPSGLTGTDGWGRLAGIPLDTSELSVHATRHGSVTVPLPPGDEPVIVVLESCAVLEIVVETPNGEPPTGLSVRLEADKAILEGVAVTGDRWREQLGVDRPEGGTLRYARDGVVEAVSMAIPFRGTARLLLSCVHPGVEVTLVLEDSERQSVGAAVQVTLEAGEQRAVALAPGRGPVDVVCRVEDPEGQPVAGALVRLGTWWRATTDGEGRAILENVYSDRVALDVLAEGFRPTRGEDDDPEVRPVPRPGEVLRLVLEREG